MMTHRSKKQLEQAIQRAKNTRGKAIAYYELGLFHDNNARETEAIPNYLKALELGLNSEMKARALAWLASSLYKTGKSKEAFRRCLESQGITRNRKLQKFLKGLGRRIGKSL